LNLFQTFQTKSETMNGNKGRLKIHPGKEGTLKAATDKGRELLGRYLEEDVQESSSHCHELLAAIERIASMDEERWEQTGNAHTVILEKDGATIESEMDEGCEPLHLTLDEFRVAVQTWLASIVRREGAS